MLGCLGKQPGRRIIPKAVLAEEGQEQGETDKEMDGARSPSDAPRACSELQDED